MGVIKEVQTGLGTTYVRYNNEGDVIQRAGVVGFSKEYEEFTYFILTDLQGNKISEANQYLNDKLGGSSYKKRELAFTALKLLYSFFDLHRILNYESGLDEADVAKLVKFLEGGSYKGTYWDQQFETTRRNQTINDYFGVYRDYYKKVFEIKDSAIHDKVAIGVRKGKNGTMLGHTSKQTVEVYKNNKQVRQNTSVPKYIKPYQYEAILAEIEKNYTVRDKAIVELMYKYGLRLGEVLGLTLEDILEGTQDNHRLFIRNRLQDEPWQHGKGLHIINNPSDYKKEVYIEEGPGLGYHLIVIDDDMMELLQEYIDESRDEFLLNRYEIKRRNLETKAIADKVTAMGVEGIEGADVNQNQYVFLNHQHYTPLTAAGWNYSLRRIFTAVGIKVDEKKRKNNLSHRFRHGFAMYKAHVMGYTQERLAKALRHSGILSVMKYYNPDEEDRIALLREQRKFMQKGGYSFEGR